MSRLDELYKKLEIEILTSKSSVIFHEDLSNRPTMLSDRGMHRSKASIQSAIDINIESHQEDILNFCVNSSMAWSFSAEDTDFIYGGFRINGLLEALAAQSDFWKIDFSLGPSDIVPEELKHFERLNWFDKQAWGDDERFGCFIREKGVFPPKMAFFDRNWYVELTLSLDEYIDAMFASCAIKGWQYFYVDWNQEIPHKEKALIDMELAVQYLPELFPERDFTYHKNKLKEVKQILG